MSSCSAPFWRISAARGWRPWLAQHVQNVVSTLSKTVNPPSSPSRPGKIDPKSDWQSAKLHLMLKSQIRLKDGQASSFSQVEPVYGTASRAKDKETWLNLHDLNSRTTNLHKSYQASYCGCNDMLQESQSMLLLSSAPAAHSLVSRVSSGSRIHSPSFRLGQVHLQKLLQTCFFWNFF